MKKTFIVTNKHLCVGADYWSAHEVTMTDDELSQILPVEDRVVRRLSVWGTYINRDKDRIITRIA